MRKMLSIGLIPFALFLLVQCTSVQGWSGHEDYSVDRPGRSERAAIEDRFNSIQRKIDTYRSMVRITDEDARDFQIRLDQIKRDYTRMMEGGFIKPEDSRISHRLNQLERDIDQHGR